MIALALFGLARRYFGAILEIAPYIWRDSEKLRHF
jgi:hypothetical protein